MKDSKIQTEEKVEFHVNLLFNYLSKKMHSMDVNKSIHSNYFITRVITQVILCILGIWFHYSSQG